MLNERQSGKLRLCLILLITALVAFVACTVIGTLMIRGAKKVPAEIDIPGSVVESDGALRDFRDLYRQYLGNGEFPGTVSTDSLGLGTEEPDLSALRSGVSDFTWQLDKAEAILNGLRQEAEEASRAEGAQPVSVDTLLTDMLNGRKTQVRISDADGNYLRSYTDRDLEDALRYLGLSTKTAPAAAIPAAVISDGTGAGADATPAPAPAAPVITETTVSQRLREVRAKVNAAQKRLESLDARTAMLNRDWDTLTQYSLGLALPPDWLAQNTNTFGDASWVRGQRYTWDRMDELLTEAAKTAPLTDDGTGALTADRIEQLRASLGERPEIETAPIWWDIAMYCAVTLTLATAWLALHAAEKGRKLAAVIWASFFALLSLPLAVSRAWMNIDILRSTSFDWQPLAGAAGYALAALLILAFYGYAYTAHRVKSRKLALGMLLAGLLAIVALAARDIMPILNVSGRGAAISGSARLAFILVSGGRLLLWMLTIAAIILGVRRSDDRRPASEPSMFPALDAYRVNLRKERA